MRWNKLFFKLHKNTRERERQAEANATEKRRRKKKASISVEVEMHIFIETLHIFSTGHIMRVFDCGAIKLIDAIIIRI